MKTKQEKIIVPSIEFYDMAIRNLTSSVAKRKQCVDYEIFFAKQCKDLLKGCDDYCKWSDPPLQEDIDEQKLIYKDKMLEAKKAIKSLAETQRIEKKMLAHYIQLKRELTDGVKACNNFVEESCNTQ